MLADQICMGTGGKHLKIEFKFINKYDSLGRGNLYVEIRLPSHFVRNSSFSTIKASIIAGCDSTCKRRKESTKFRGMCLESGLETMKARSDGTTYKNNT